VDVFFSKDFFGRFLIPCVLVSTEETYKLMKKIYTLKNTITALSDISQDPVYTSLLEKFPHMEAIISNEVQKMVSVVMLCL
jgi:hypothetical protein